MIDTPEALYTIPQNDTEAGTKAILRLAVAIEQLTLAIMDKGLPVNLQTVTMPPVANLPPAQTPVTYSTANARVCPIHGADKVKASTKRGIAFYCTGKLNDGTWCRFSVAA